MKCVYFHFTKFIFTITKAVIYKPSQDILCPYKVLFLNLQKNTWNFFLDLEFYRFFKVLFIKVKVKDYATIQVWRGKYGFPFFKKHAQKYVRYTSKNWGGGG